MSERAIIVSNIYGWRPDLPDPRDHIWQPRPTVGRLPRRVDLRADMPEIWDQGTLGACSAFSVTAALEYAARKEGHDDGRPSQLFVYYNERKDQGTVPYDSGATIRESVKAVNAYGACPDTEWGYDPAKFTWPPPEDTYKDALFQRALTYERIQLTTGSSFRSVVNIKRAMAMGYPVMTGIAVFSSFESIETAQTGMIPMPDTATEQLLGGHAVLLGGYDDSIRRFILRNSWGTGWGDQGYGYIPYAYIANPMTGNDFWVITGVGASAPS